MSRLVLGHDKLIADYVAESLGMIQGFGECSAFGVVDSKGSLIAGIVYSNLRDPSIEMSIASTHPTWCTRDVLKLMFLYPFVTLGCSRITTLVGIENKKSIKFTEKLGGVREGTLRGILPSGDAHIYRMLKSECRWI